MIRRRYLDQKNTSNLLFVKLACTRNPVSFDAIHLSVAMMHSMPVQSEMNEVMIEICPRSDA